MSFRDKIWLILSRTIRSLWVKFFSLRVDPLLFENQSPIWVFCCSFCADDVDVDVDDASRDPTHRKDLTSHVHSFHSSPKAFRLRQRKSFLCLQAAAKKRMFVLKKFWIVNFSSLGRSPSVHFCSWRSFFSWAQEVTWAVQHHKGSRTQSYKKNWA